jgi:hypothetical protein
MGIFSWFSSSKSPEEPRGRHRRGFASRERDDEKLREMKEAAAEDAAAMREEDRRYFSQDGPQHQPDDDL